MLSALGAFLEELGQVSAGRSPEALGRPTSDGRRRAVENLRHPRDSEVIFLERAEAILKEDPPLLLAYHDEL